MITNYDDWKTTEPDVPAGPGIKHRCLDCDWRGNGLNAWDHHAATHHRMSLINGQPVRFPCCPETPSPDRCENHGGPGPNVLLRSVREDWQPANARPTSRMLCALCAVSMARNGDTVAPLTAADFAADEAENRPPASCGHCGLPTVAVNPEDGEGSCICDME